MAGTAPSVHVAVARSRIELLSSVTARRSLSAWNRQIGREVGQGPRCALMRQDLIGNERMSSRPREVANLAQLESGQTS
jgi:hypothetical protein